jgi:hypothetical protein
VDDVDIGPPECDVTPTPIRLVLISRRHRPAAAGGRGSLRDESGVHPDDLGVGKP